ncbi:MAG: TlpA disulfide reductase family protein [Pseudomonadota bacterium]
MNRLSTMLASLKQPMTMIKVMMAIGGAGVMVILLSSLGGAPKPWEDTRPVYTVGEMEAFERTFPSRPLPSVPLKADGQDVALSSFADGRVLVINLWATWCGPCVDELPSLAALQRALGDQVHVIAVAMEPGEGLRQRALLERLGADNLTLLMDPKLSLGKRYSDPLTLPVTVIYDGRGREIGVLPKPANWESPEAQRLVRAIAAGGVPR